LQNANLTNGGQFALAVFSIAKTFADIFKTASTKAITDAKGNHINSKISRNRWLN
jgi:hypothetical protein